MCFRIELEKRIYKKSEMTQLFHTDRTDSIRRSLERAGYSYVCSGRGKTYQIEITALPAPPAAFDTFAAKYLDCGSTTNFDAMKIYFLLLFYHPTFLYFPATYQAQYMKENYGIDVSDQTLRNWKEKLAERNLIEKDTENVRFYACKKGEVPREISMEDHKNAWREFFSRTAAGENPSELRKEIYYKYNGLPRKQCGFMENIAAEDSKILLELHRILESLPEYQEITQIPKEN